MAIIGGAGSGAPTGSRVRVPCSVGGGVKHVHAAQLIAAVRVQSLGLASTRPAAPIEVEVQVWGLPARRTTSATQQHAPMAVVVSVVLAHALVVPSAVLGWYIFPSSSHRQSAVKLFPWDPGGHSCSSNLFHIFVLNNKGKSIEM